MKNKLASSINNINKFKQVEDSSNETNDATRQLKISTLSGFSDFSMLGNLNWLTEWRISSVFQLILILLCLCLLEKLFVGNLYSIYMNSFFLINIFFWCLAQF